MNEHFRQFQSESDQTSRSCHGHSLLELLMVVAIIGALSSLAIPQLIAERRLSRAVGITREIQTQMRLARQFAMSQRQAFTFQYDNATKQISIIDHNSNLGRTMLSDPAYPNTAGSTVIAAIPLGDTVSSPEITYGIPTGLPNGALGDGVSMTALFDNRLNVTFQPDGSIIDAAGNPQSRAMFIYNNRASQATASAISVLGASGRVKIWRYQASGNLYVD